MNHSLKWKRLIYFGFEMNPFFLKWNEGCTFWTECSRSQMQKKGTSASFPHKKTCFSQDHSYLNPLLVLFTWRHLSQKSWLCRFGGQCPCVFYSVVCILGDMLTCWLPTWWAWHSHGGRRTCDGRVTGNSGPVFWCSHVVVSHVYQCNQSEARWSN